MVDVLPLAERRTPFWKSQYQSIVPRQCAESLYKKPSITFSSFRRENLKNIGVRNYILGLKLGLIAFSYTFVSV